MKNMKKIICLVLCLIMAMSWFTFSAYAASNNEKLLKDISNTIPSKNRSTHLPQAKKIVRQITISNDQYKQLKAILDETKTELALKKKSVHMYTGSEQTYIMDQFDKALDVMDMSMTAAIKKKTLHEGDYIFTIYNAKGKKLGTLDGDVSPNKTDSAVPVWAWAFALVAVMAAVGGAVVYGRRKKLAE